MLILRICIPSIAASMGSDLGQTTLWLTYQIRIWLALIQNWVDSHYIFIQLYLFRHIHRFVVSILIVHCPRHWSLSKFIIVCIDTGAVSRFKHENIYYSKTCTCMYTGMSWGQRFIPVSTGSDLDRFFSFGEEQTTTLGQI